MNKSESIKQLALALSKAQGAFEHAKKDENNPFFKSKYANLASVIDAAKVPLSENGLSIAQVVDCEENGPYLETILMHSSGEWISGQYPLKPVKPDPQSIGSAITYARRYAFSAITGIAADDDDGNSASGVNKPTYREELSQQAIDYFAMIDDAKTGEELKQAWLKIPTELKPTYAKVKDAQKKVIASAINGTDDVPNFPSHEAA
jgi:hypothetical protein